MNRKLASITIGIPAYNEEDNILNLIESIVNQKLENVYIKEIIVVSDHSSDATEKIVKSISDERVTLIRNKKRLGQALSQNVILEKFKGDIVVFLNGDTVIDLQYIEEITKPIIENKNIGIVSGKVVPFQADTLFSKIIDFSHNFKNELYTKISKNNIYLCHGRSRAFSKLFAKKFRWPELTTEDAFSYLACISNGFDFYYQPSAKVYFKSPSTYLDHEKQSRRFLGSKDEIRRFFNKEVLKKQYEIPKNIVAYTLIKYFLINPFYFTVYIFIYIYILLKFKETKLSSAIWERTRTSQKKVVNIVTQYYYPVRAGIEMSTVEIAKRLVSEGYYVNVYTTNRDLEGNLININKSEFQGVKIYRSSRIKFLFLLAPINNCDILILENYNVLPHTLLLIFIIFRRQFFNDKIKVVFEPHGGFTPDFSIFNKITAVIKVFFHTFLGSKLINEAVDSIRAVSQWEKAELRKVGINNDIYVVENGIEPIAFKKKLDVSIDFMTQIKKNKPYIVILGRIHPIKNIDIVIKAVANLSEKYHLFVVGPKTDINYYNSLVNLVEKNSLQDCIHFTGPIYGEEKYYLLRNCFLQIHVARWENDSIAIKDGKSQGALILAGIGYGLKNSITDKVSGFQIAKITPSDIKHSIEKISSMPASMTLSIKDKAKKESIKYHWDHVYEKYRELL